MRAGMGDLYGGVFANDKTWQEAVVAAGNDSGDRQYIHAEVESARLRCAEHPLTILGDKVLLDLFGGFARRKLFANIPRRIRRFLSGIASR